MATQIYNHFSIPQVPEGHRRIDTLPLIILIGGTASRNSEYQTMRPIGSTSTTGVTVWGMKEPRYHDFQMDFDLSRLYVCAIE